MRIYDWNTSHGKNMKLSGVYYAAAQQMWLCQPTSEGGLAPFIPYNTSKMAPGLIYTRCIIMHFCSQLTLRIEKMFSLCHKCHKLLPFQCHCKFNHILPNCECEFAVYWKRLQNKYQEASFYGAVLSINNLINKPNFQNKINLMRKWFQRIVQKYKLLLSIIKFSKLHKQIRDFLSSINK